jgi:UDP-N-acetylmuramyl pentapeptide phosphotransferase/UDP-N-acetylglucosamine-1-phosphate transferase
MHASPVPRGAGICFASVALAVSFATLIWDINHLQRYFYIYIAIAIVFAAGLLDDRKGLSPKLKFIRIEYYVFNMKFFFPC